MQQLQHMISLISVQEMPRMVVRKRHLLVLGITLTCMGYIYTVKDQTAKDFYQSANMNKKRVVMKTMLCHNLTETPEGAEQSNLQPVTAIVHTAWERYPGETWKGLQLPVITADPRGRLGNVMGEYASLFALGKAYNATVRLNPIMKFYLRREFPRLSMPLIPGKYIKSRWTPVSGVTKRNYAKMQVAAAGILGPKLFRITEWPFEIQLFNAYRKEILQEFEFSTAVQREVTEFLRDQLEKHYKNVTTRPVLVGIHVRRKDYVTFIQKNYNGTVPGDSYYKRAMDYFREKYNQVLFMVGSDDMLYVKKHFGEHPDVIFGPGSTRVVDMAALAACNHSIISLGSFGFWTGYLSGGEVLYPNLTFGVPYQFSPAWYKIAKLNFFTPISAE